VNFCYGRNGKYKSYLTYSKSNIKKNQDDLNFSICKNRNWLGKLFDVWGINKENVVRRLTFNPMIDEMMEDIFAFIASIETEVIK
jgi:hypothetical protein